KMGVAKQAARPKAYQSLVSGMERIKRVLTNIDSLEPRISGWTTGLGGSLMDWIPGTEARDFAADVDTIKANLGFEELERMRRESPTGGALGQVTERELAFLQSVVANLENSQSPEQFRQYLQRVKDAARCSWENVRRAY